MALLKLTVILAQFAPLSGDDPSQRFCMGACSQGQGFSHLAPADLTTRSTPHDSVAFAATKSVRPDLKNLRVDIVLNETVLGHIRKFTQGRGRYTFAGWYARMGRYEVMMRSILEGHGLPPEIIYICMIESGFSPDAVSRAGAVGPWQFMPDAGRVYGLRHDDWVDERRDPVKATHAAAKLLKDLHRRFGTWPLAFAAYNAGPGAIIGPIRRNGTNDFWRLVELGAIPRGAAWYASRAMAAMVVGHNIELYEFDKVRKLATIDPVRVDVPGGIDLAAIAKKIGMKHRKLADLNPELRRGFTPTYPGGYALNVPRSKAKQLMDKVVELEKRKTRVYQPYNVRFGERLSDIAYRFQITRSTLVALNNISTQEPSAGLEIMVPRRAPRADRMPKLSVLQDPKLKFSYPSRQLAYFPVRRHLSLVEIAAFFDVSTGMLAMWNGLDPNLPVQRGMVLRVYLKKGFDRSRAMLVNPSSLMKVDAGSPGAQAALRFLRSSRSKNRTIKLHTIKRGDNLRKIARKYKVDRDAIRAVNGGKKRIRMVVGKTIRIPVSDASRPRGKAAKRRPKVEIRGKRYMVKKGDTLSKIARKFGVELKALRKKNRIDKRGRIRVGQDLVMP